MFPSIIYDDLGLCPSGKDIQSISEVEAPLEWITVIDRMMRIMVSRGDLQLMWTPNHNGSLVFFTLPKL
jgi:hypothetical protein